MLDLRAFNMTEESGFLPAWDPVGELPPWFSAWDEMGRDLPKLLMSDHLRPMLERMRVLDFSQLESQAEQERGMMLLSYFGHAYVWGAGEPAKTLPASIAIPWSRAAEYLGRPPVLSYASYALHNWRRIDPKGPVALGNIALRQNFLGGMDEEWFILVHVDIEAKAAPALTAFAGALEAAGNDDPGKLTPKLAAIAESISQMCATLDRMPERCDPYIYFHRVRPYLYGWKDQPALPEGMIYLGAFGEKPRKFRGETGAQSGIIPALDALLGITHREDPLRLYLLEMRDYMPPAHRAFVAAVEKESAVRACVEKHLEILELREKYDACVKGIHRFRARHLEYAALYINSQNRTSRANPNDVGTGGTPFMEYLKKHRDETVAS